MNAIQIIEIVQAIIAILLPNFGTLIFYVLFNIHSPNIYDGLIVPSWTPPFLTFKLIWTCFYCIIGYASFLVLKEITLTGNQALTKNAKVVLILLYLTHIPLCWAWLPTLGGLKYTGVAAVIMIVATTSAIYISPIMWVVNKKAAILYFPIIAWTSFLAAWCFMIRED